eukprot:16320978-Heterocapsa_arctica.AAC.1
MVHPTKLGAINYSGWGLWSPDDQSFNEKGPLKGISQSSDRAEVRALFAALEKAEEDIYIITDNQYVRDTAQTKAHLHKMTSIRWVKAHPKKEKATAAGVSYED